MSGSLRGRVRNVSGLPVIENFMLNATYSLVEIATKKTVVQGRATTTVSYDPAGTQRYARVTGMQDAERRAAKVIARNQGYAFVPAWFPPAAARPGANGSFAQDWTDHTASARKPGLPRRRTRPPCFGNFKDAFGVCIEFLTNSFCTR